MIYNTKSRKHRNVVAASFLVYGYMVLRMFSKAYKQCMVLLSFHYAPKLSVTTKKIHSGDPFTFTINHVCYLQTNCLELWTQALIFYLLISMNRELVLNVKQEKNNYYTERWSLKISKVFYCDISFRDLVCWIRRT